MQLRRILLPHTFAALALAICLTAGCGQTEKKSAAELDASGLLALLQERHQVDAKHFVEVDLSRFRVVHKLDSGEGHLYVQFHLFAILPEDRQSRLAELWPQFEKRARDAIIALVQRTETEHLSDPSLSFFKEEVTASVNRILQERLLVDVVFSDFSTDAEPGMPWSVPMGEAKPKSSGHGGGHGH